MFIKEERRKPTRKTLREFLANSEEHKQLHDALVKCMVKCNEEFQFRTSDTTMMNEILRPPDTDCPTAKAKKVTFEKSVV